MTSKIDQAWSVICLGSTRRQLKGEEPAFQLVNGKSLPTLARGTSANAFTQDRKAKCRVSSSDDEPAMEMFPFVALPPLTTKRRQLAITEICNENHRKYIQEGSDGGLAAVVDHLAQVLPAVAETDIGYIPATESGPAEHLYHDSEGTEGFAEMSEYETLRYNKYLQDLAAETERERGTEEQSVRVSFSS